MTKALAALLFLGIGYRVVAAQTSSDVAAPAEAFLGTWTGHWDKTWLVTFTIKQDADKKKISASYNWEEHPGHPLHHLNFDGKIDGSKLLLGSLIEITLAKKDTNMASALGHFPTERTAELTRVAKDGDSK